MKTFVIIAFILSVQTSFTLSAQNGLLAEYYNGQNFDQKIFSRMESQINYDWGYDGPAPGKIDGTSFSASWAGRIYAPASGKYTFSAHVDDGVRVWVGNVRVIDAWNLHDSESFKGDIMLEQGKYYPIKVEYYNGMREGEFQLFWSVPEANSNPADWFWSKEKIIEPKYFFPPAVPAKPAPPAVAKPAPPPVKPAVTPAKPQPPKANTPIPVKAEKKPVAPPLPEILRPEATPALRSVYFEKSTDVLVLNSVERLEIVIQYMKSNASATIELTGHTDVVGDSNSNQKLSEERASLVGDYLVNKGIVATRISTKGVGSTQPLYVKPGTESEHSLNRRVEFKVKL